MENRRFGLGVFCMIFNKDFSKILLVKRNEEKRKKYGADWGNIGGRIEFDKSTLAERENQSTGISPYYAIAWNL